MSDAYPSAANSNVDAYEQVSKSVGLSDRSPRERILLAGPDRAKFLHNLTTNEIKKLQAPHGRETFVTTPQGKVLGYILVHATEDETLLVRTDVGGVEGILPHFEKYGIFDDVVISHISAETFELHLFGLNTEKLVGLLTDVRPDPEEFANVAARIADRDVRLIRESPTGNPGVTIIGARDSLTEVSQKIRELGAPLGLIEIDEPTFDLLRIEAGTPVFGRDITAKNLPQEVDRDSRAISFVKGCYLGQETVARIDALGHVNQLLRGICLEPGSMGPLEVGGTLKRDGKDLATLTSVAFSPGWGTWIGLGYVRTAAIDSRGPLEVFDSSGNPVGTARISDLPMKPMDRG